jgi:hypothetical protein
MGGLFTKASPEEDFPDHIGRLMNMPGDNLTCRGFDGEP